ncbi:MAG: hypothetical protein ACOYON_04175 [Fimbriimonas sp.]
MTWRRKEDLGTQIVAKVYESLKFNDHWSLDVGRGFTYWASDFALTVKADMGNFHNAYTIFRIYSEFDLLKGKGKPGEIEIALAAKMRNASLSALIYDEETDRYKLDCSIYAHEDNAEWLTRVFVSAVGLQVARGHTLAKELAKDLKISAATSSHPENGLRQTPDPMIDAMERFFRPIGQQPSKWLNSTEWQDARDQVRRVAIESSTDGTSGLKATFDWLTEKPIELEITANSVHAELGNGLTCQLRVPWGSDHHNAAHIAQELNNMERKGWNWCHDLGSWSAEGGTILFICFVPNISFAPNALPEITHDMANRAKWVNETAALAAMGVDR